MRKTILIFLIFFFSTISAEVQDSLKHKWIPSWIGSINISQVSFKNWTGGGEDSFAWAFKSDYDLYYHSDSWSFRTDFNVEYGRTKLGEADFRTTGNDIYVENVLSLNIGWAVDPYVSNLFRTQLLGGYNYKVDPYIKIADFFDPAYMVQSCGFTYDRIKNFSTRFGLAFKETYTNNHTQYSDDPKTPETERFKFETGIETVTSGKLNLAENVDYIGALRLFTRFESLDIWDVRWDSTINATVNSWLNVNFNFILLYEKAQSMRTQIKEALQVGFKYKIL